MFIHMSLAQIVQPHLSMPLYKLILGWPIMMTDLQYFDTDLFTNLMKVVPITKHPCACAYAGACRWACV